MQRIEKGLTNMLNRANYKYIYSVNFANYLMTQGVVCKGTGISRKTGKYFWAFDYDECQPVYEKINKNQECGFVQDESK